MLGDSRKKSLLLVEDDAIIALSEAQKLEQEGYKVIIAASGEKAIELVCNKKEPIDLILMDIDLGNGLDGTEAAQKILREHNLPVVFLSSHTERDIVQKTEKITSYGYVVKDAGITVLVASIKMAFKLHEARMGLQISEERYHTFIQRSSEGIYRMELQQPIDISLPVEEQADILLNFARIAECNDAFVAMYNADSPSELIGFRIADFHGGKIGEATRAGTMKFIESGYRQNNNETIETTIDGRTVHFSNNTIGIIEKGVLRRIWGTQTDITARKQAEEARNESEAKFREILESSRDIHYRQDLETLRIDYVSPFVQTVLGYHPEDVLAMGIEKQTSLFHAEDLPGLLSFREELLQADSDGQKFIERDFRMLHKSGEPRWMHGQYFLVRKRNNEPKFVVGVLRDITLNKQTEQALHDSEEHFRRLSEDTPCCICTFLPDGTVTYVNPALIELTGMKPEQLVGRKFFDLMSSQELEYLQSRLKKLTPTNPTESHEQTCETPDGSRRFVEWRQRGFFDKNGSAIRYLALGVDITRRKQTEEALRESETLYRTLLEASPDAAILSDLDGRILIANQQAARLHGFRDAKDMIGMNGFELIAPEDRQRSMDHSPQPAETLSGDGLGSFEFTLLHQDGSRVIGEFHARIVPDPEGHPRTILSLVRDISERRRAETALLESEALYRTLVETVPHSIVLNDRTGTIIMANPQAAKLHGFESSNELIGKNALELIAPEDRPRMKTLLSQATPEETGKFEVLLLRKDGSRFSGELFGRMIFTPVGKPDILMTIVVDTMEQRWTEPVQAENRIH